ncbi:hypothetical protein RJT34_06958 [Clitoria ternatea]|uniref:At1g68980-like TPR repeats domain-containing protein n=1 Tax=Clitoria ternatea TaxID=43366 RepID=A0AAN9PTT3_CLITE
MARRVTWFLPDRAFFSSTPEIPTLYSFLQPSVFSLNKKQQQPKLCFSSTHYTFPPKPLTNSLITHLSSLGDIYNLKRAFASVVFLMEKNPLSMFKNRFFVPFGVWGHFLVDIGRNNGNLAAFLGIFYENCRVALVEKLEFMKPDVAACNAALEACCYELESVSDAERVVGTMSDLGVRPDEFSFGFLGYLYAHKGL